MKESTKLNMAPWGVVLIFITISFIWYMLILNPQRKAAVGFLESLRTRNEDMLLKTVDFKEFPVYKDLYLKNGFNKHLISYGTLQERDANNYFFPTGSRFSVDITEDDVFFGRRTQEYFVVLAKEKDGWKVIQFSTYQDREDLNQLKEFNPEPDKQK